MTRAEILAQRARAEAACRVAEALRERAWVTAYEARAARLITRCALAISRSRRLTAGVLTALLLCVSLAEASTPRNPQTVRDFRTTHPCPHTGITTGPCPGYVVDHKYPLCAGGADAVDNMMWQEYAASLVKDQLERELCACKGR